MIILGILAAVVLLYCVFLGYRYQFGPFRALGERRLRNLPGNSTAYDMALVEPLEDSPLAGKRVLFLGSSVTFGASSLQQGIPEYFAARFGCDYVKEAVSGTTLVDLGETSYIQRLLNRVDASEKFDLVVCQLSTNDATRKLPLGEIAPGKDRNALDTSCVTGAMEFIIAYAQETWDCPVAFYTGSRYGSEVYAAMVARVLELKEKWGIRVFDLWNDEAFNAISPEDRALFMNDPIHPTKAGYRQWWCPEMERQLLQQK